MPRNCGWAGPANSSPWASATGWQVSLPAQNMPNFFPAGSGCLNFLARRGNPSAPNEIQNGQYWPGRLVAALIALPEIRAFLLSTHLRQWVPVEPV